MTKKKNKPGQGRKPLDRTQVCWNVSPIGAIKFSKLALLTGFTWAEVGHPGGLISFIGKLEPTELEDLAQYLKRLKDKRTEVQSHD